MIANFYKSSLIVFCLLTGMLQAQSGNSRLQSVSCDSYIDAGPVNRMTGSGEENIINNLYSGLAQRYNNISGNVTAVRFWARVPLSVGSSQTVKVIIYQENVGFPGTLLAQTNVMVPASASLIQIDAPISPSITVGSNIIIAIEPYAAATNNVWIKHNEEGNLANGYIGNGGNLYLNLVKQGVTWYKDLANGDPSWDYDFLIMPVTTVSINSAFTHTTNNLIATFNNTTANASSSIWDFGDGNTSAQTSPVHAYAVAGTYQVKLKSFSAQSSCYDSIIHPVTVTLTGINDISDKTGLQLNYSSVTKTLTLYSDNDAEVSILNILGRSLGKHKLQKRVTKEISLEQFANGIYFVMAPKKSYKFIIQ